MTAARWAYRIIVTVLAGAFIWYSLGLHIVFKPTADQLFGCTWENTTPDGECK